MNPFESLIAAVAPRAALKRQAARLQLEQLRRYDADARGRRVDSWGVRQTSADSALGPEGGLKRERARDLVRNNPYAQRIIQLWVDALVGHGWSFKAKAGRRNGGARGQRVTDEFRAWAADPQQCDYEGLQDLAGLIAKAVACWKESGEVLIRWRTPSNAAMRRLGLRVPLQLQVMEPDWIDENHDTPAGEQGGYTKRGIVYDAEGKRESYWIYNYHPGESALRAVSIESNTVPASQIIHLFTPKRPGQTRGATCLAPVVIALRDLDDYLDAQLLKQKISACMTGVIVDVDGAGDQKSDVGERIEPGAMVRLGPGQDIRFSSPPSVGEIDKIMRGYLLRIAAGTNVPYELLTGDFQGTNFSAGRLGWQSFNKQTVSEQWQLLAPVMNRIWQWFSAQTPTPTDGLSADWTPPPPQPYDPAADTKATISKMRAGLKPPQEAIREEGLEPDEVLEQYREWNAQLDAGGIVLDTDPRKVSAAGLTQARPIGSELPPTGEPPEEATPPPQVTPAGEP